MVNNKTKYAKDIKSVLGKDLLQSQAKATNSTVHLILI